MIPDNIINVIAFESGNKENASVIPSGKEVKVVITPVYGDDTIGGKSEMTSGDDIVSLTVSDHGEVRHIAVVVQQYMKLYSAFGLAEFSPGKEAQTRIYGSGIEAEQFIPEAKFPLLSGILVAKQVIQTKENVLIKLPGSMGIRIGKCTLGKSTSRQSQMIELATSDIQTISDFPQALGLSQSAKQHGPKRRIPWRGVLPHIYGPAA